MAILPPLASPTSQPLSPIQQGTTSPKKELADATTVKPLNAADGSEIRRQDAGDSSYGNSRRETDGVNRIQTNDRSDAQPGPLTKARNTEADGNRQRPDAAPAQSTDRARGASQSYEAGNTVGENAIKAELAQRAKDAPPREGTSTQDARVKTEQFKATLSDVRKAEVPVANDNERPVSLDTNASSEPVGRYDKSA